MGGVARGSRVGWVCLDHSGIRLMPACSWVGWSSPSLLSLHAYSTVPHASSLQALGQWPGSIFY